MQLLVGVKDTWKCVEVQLEDGCVPCIGGVALKECNLEPALWFKVLVLDSVCVDCSEHVVSWSVSPSLANMEGSVSTVITPTVERKIALESSAAPLENSLNHSTTSKDSTCSTNGTETTKRVQQILHYPRSSPRLNRASQRRSPSSSPPSTRKDHSPLSSLSIHLQTSGPKDEGLHSLMAPHEGETVLFQDDLQSLFDLAEVLFRVNPSCLIHTRGQDVEQRSWLRLLHCYILPLISLHHKDLPAVERAHSLHSDVLHSLDQRILDSSTKVMEFKNDLVILRENLVPSVQAQAEKGLCSLEFLKFFTFDLKQVEEDGRNQIQSALKNLELCKKLSMPVSSEMERKFLDQNRAGQTLLVETLELRGALERSLALIEPLSDQDGGDDGERPHPSELEKQKKYVVIHRELRRLRDNGTSLSKKKVLALSVREALQQTLDSLRLGKTTTGIDIGLHGGHSTDVLPEASCYAATNEFTTLKDKIQKLLQLRSNPASGLHNAFCKELRRDYFPSMKDGEEFVIISKPISVATLSLRALTMPSGQARPRRNPEMTRHWTLLSRHRSPSRLSPAPLPSLPSIGNLSNLVKEHFEKIVEAVCQYFNDHDADFIQRAWLCYERIFFEVFAGDFLSLYQMHHTKFCEQLQLNCVSVSIVDPSTLNLGLEKTSWISLFQSRSFEKASQLYSKLTDQSYLEGSKTGELDPKFRVHFGGVVSDLESIPLSISPLERLQLLTSAFRKSMAALSTLKMEPLLEDVDSLSSFDANLAGVSCDDLLPLLILLLLQLHPSFVANLHLQCCFLDDYIAPFLTSGWHGYSLTAFRSALQVLAEL